MDSKIIKLKLSTTKPKTKKMNKKKLSKQLVQEQNHRNRDHMEGYQWGRGVGGEWGKGTGIKKHNWPWLVWLSALSASLRIKGSLVRFPV